MSDLVQTRQSLKYPNLFLRRYKGKVFYDNLWHRDPLLLESRGHVTLSDGTLVINPFTKVFNYKENHTAIPDDETVLAVEKINGFMAAVTWVEAVQDVVVSTSGSLDSNHTTMATSMLSYVIEQLRSLRPSSTYIFEICHPSEPHIIQENIGVYLLGIRSTLSTTPYHSTFSDEQLLDVYARKLRASRPAYMLTTFASAKALLPTCTHEGYMVYAQSVQQSLKLKSPYYLALKAMSRKQDILSLDRQRVDEEFYPLLDHLRELGSTFSDKPEQERLTYIKYWLQQLGA
jgi:hypothetical protein